MAFDFFTLKALARELGERIGGKEITRVGSCSTGLAFACQSQGQLYARVGREGFLCYSTAKWPEEMIQREGAERYLLGAQVEEVQAERRDRILRVRLVRRNREGETTFGALICELIHPCCQALLISERTGEVLGRWGTGSRNSAQRSAVGKRYAPPSAQERLLPGEDDFEQFCRKVEGENEEIGRVGPQILTGMDRSTFAEILHRAGLDKERTASGLTKGELGEIWEVAVELYATPPGSGAFLWQEGNRFLFSALESTRSGITTERYPSVSEALLGARQRNRDREQNERKKQQFAGQLRRIIRSLGRKIDGLSQEIEEAGGAEEMEKKGNVLIAQLQKVRRGVDVVELPDIYDISGRTKMRIELNPERSPAENASWYLKTARKYQRRRQVLPQRFSRCLEQIEVLNGFLRGLESEEGVDRETMDRWLMENGLVNQKAGAQRRGKKDQVHPRRYRTSSGWSVWAGRNNKENDILTHRIAAQNDVWFHAHGYPGSHVVLRREGRKDEPSRETLEEAASVAAYWSKGKTARKVAVVYTLVKYVSKQRGAAPGQAVLRREKTLMVKPGLLPEEDAECKKDA